MQTRLRDRIKVTVAQQKAAKLDADLPVRKWLQDLKASSALPLHMIRRSIRVDYQEFMSDGFVDWPTGGPSNWLGKWEDLISRAEKYNVPLEDWLTDVSTVWRPVPALRGYFDTVEHRVMEQKQGKYSTASVSAAIQQNWERIVQGQVVKRAKPKATRSLFSTEEATSNREEADSSEGTKTQTKKIGKRGGKGKRERREERSQRSQSRSPSPRPRSRSRSPRPHRAKKRGDRQPCSACGGFSHSFATCFLVRGQEKDSIVEEARDRFTKNMKVASFKKKVDDYREAIAVIKEVEREYGRKRSG